MKRKVSKIGQSTLMVSLPHKWVKKYNIEKGDEVEVEIDGGIITIRQPGKSKQSKEWRMTLNTTYPKIIRIQLNTIYRSGYDRIIINYQNTETIKIIRKLVSDYLLGFEIVQEEKNKCIIEALTVPTPDKASVILRKVFFIIHESLDILSNDVKRECFDNYEQMYELMIRCGRFCNFFSRTLFKEKELDPFVWTMVQKLLMFQHLTHHCYKAVINSKYKKFSNETYSYLCDVKKLFRNFETIYYKKDFSAAEDIAKQKDDLLYTQIPKLQKKEADLFIAPHLYAMVRIMPILGGSMAEVLTQS